MSVWIAVDVTTGRLIAFGKDQSNVKLQANMHKKLSGNEVKLRTLKIGMIIHDLG